MPKLAANLSFLFQELHFLDRFDAAARHGFGGVEFLFPYEWPLEDVRRAARDANVQIVLFNLPPGDWDAGDRGLAAVPGREEEFDASLERAYDAARALGTVTLHCMAGLSAGADARATYHRNLRAALDRAPGGVRLTIEPINHRDMPGYHLNTSTQALATVAALADARLGVQLDLYHAQITEGDLTRRIDACAPHLFHVQIAGNPGRHEPTVGEINPHHLLAHLDTIGFDGWVGCEYRPRTTTADGLGWAASHGITASPRQWSRASS